MKLYLVKLSREEQAALRELATRARVSGLKRQRACILLKANDGWTDEEISDDLEVSVATVERVRKRFTERGLAATLERKASVRTSIPRKFDGSSEAKLVQLACSSPPSGHVRWTLSLLADKLVELEVFDSVSTSAIQGVLKKTKLSRGRSRGSVFRPRKTRPL